MAEVEVGPLDELAPGTMRFVDHGEVRIGVFNCDGALYAIEDRCSHDDGPLCEGTWDPADCTVVCPRHGAKFDLTSGRAITLPAYLPVLAYPVTVRDGLVLLDVSD